MFQLLQGKSRAAREQSIFKGEFTAINLQGEAFQGRNSGRSPVRTGSVLKMATIFRHYRERAPRLLPRRSKAAMTLIDDYQTANRVISAAWPAVSRELLMESKICWRP
jgi:hypothetical protein